MKFILSSEREIIVKTNKIILHRKYENDTSLSVNN